ncbi:MAG: hypothetical protein ACREF4_06460, partial [Gammaproteobacteria bacterium]
MQPLDVGQPVGAVDAYAVDRIGIVVRDGHDIVRRIAQCPIGLDRDRIVRQVPREHGGIEVEAAVSGQNLAHDLQ